MRRCIADKCYVLCSAAVGLLRRTRTQELNMELPDLLAHPTYLGASLMQVCVCFVNE